MESNTLTLIVTVVSGLLLAFVAGGFSVFMAVRKVAENPALLKSIEELAKSFPPETAELLNKVWEGLSDVGYILDRVITIEDEEAEEPAAG